MKTIPGYILLLVLVALSACKPKKDMIYMSKNTEGEIQAEISRARFEGLRIQEGDKLQVVVSAFDEIAVRPFNPATMQATASAAGSASGGGASGGTAATESGYTVSPDGNITMPVLGIIHVKGMTKNELKADLEQRLLKYLTDPMVTVTLNNFNFSALGEVGSPGQKTSPTEKLNIFQAIALVGDIKPSGDRTKVRIIRTSENDGSEKMVRLDLTDEAIASSPYYYIQQNDIIYVEPDRNAQIAARTTPVIDNFTKYFGIGLSVLSLALLLFRK